MWLYIILLLLHLSALYSTLLYFSSTSLYFTLHNSTLDPLHSTSLDIFLPWLYFTLHESTLFYIGYTSHHIDLLCLYITLLDSTLHYYGSTSQYLTLHYSTIALLYCTLHYSALSLLHSIWLYRLYYGSASLEVYDVWEVMELVYSDNCNYSNQLLMQLKVHVSNFQFDIAHFSDQIFICKLQCLLCQPYWFLYPL